MITKTNLNFIVYTGSLARPCPLPSTHRDRAGIGNFSTALTRKATGEASSEYAVYLPFHPLNAELQRLQPTACDRFAIV